MKRYVSGKRPDYAPMESSDEEEEDFQFVKKGKEAEPEMEIEEEEKSDPRLRRLMNRVTEDVEERYSLSICAIQFIQIYYCCTRDLLVLLLCPSQACETQADSRARADRSKQ